MDYLVPVITAILAGGAAYLGSHLKRKGENVATHEDLDKLVAQMSAVTAATKDIEAKISNDMWERQRRWEVRREALFEAIKELGTIEDRLTKIRSAFSNVAKASTVDVRAENTKLQIKALEEWNEARLEFSRAMSVASLVCSPQIDYAFLNLQKVMSEIAQLAIDSKTDQASELASKIITKQNQLTELIRKELGVDA